MIKYPKFAVVGAGAGGKAIAAHLSILGYQTNLFNRSVRRIEAIKRIGGIEVCGEIEGLAKLNIVTTSIQEAIEQVDIIMVVVPAFAHKDIAKNCAQHLRDGQIVILNPGRTGGAIEFFNVIRQENVARNITIAETQTILHTCRSLSETKVKVLGVKKRVSMAAFPATQTPKAVESLTKVFPQFIPAVDVLETGVNNMGAMLHPLPTLLNIGWIETPRTEFKYYYEGITRTVAQLIELIDSERMTIGKAIGTKVISTLRWLNAAYEANGHTLYEAIQNNKCYTTIDAPSTIHHRYLWEDVPTGLVPLASLAQLVGIDTKMIDHVIKLACWACKVDFYKSGRTIESLGLKGLSIDEIKELVAFGQIKKVNTCGK